MVLKTVSILIVELIFRGTRWWEKPTKWYCGSVRAVSIAMAADATLGVMVVPLQLPHDIEPLTSIAKRYLLLVGWTVWKERKRYVLSTLKRQVSPGIFMNRDIFKTILTILPWHSCLKNQPNQPTVLLSMLRTTYTFCVMWFGSFNFPYSMIWALYV